MTTSAASAFPGQRGNRCALHGRYGSSKLLLCTAIVQQLLKGCLSYAERLLPGLLGLRNIGQYSILISNDGVMLQMPEPSGDAMPVVDWVSGLRIRCSLLDSAAPRGVKLAHM